MTRDRTRFTIAAHASCSDGIRCELFFSKGAP